MECNKDEAFRAKEIAERKYKGRDFVGAKKFALKAQNLYPGLDNISKWLSVLDVLIVAENKVNGEMDWYGLLGADSRADEETIKRQFKKRAIDLHPDKNNSFGANDAFQVIKEAFDILNDKAKRSAYDCRRNVRTVQQKFPKPGACSMPPSSNARFSQKFSSQARMSTPSFNRTTQQKGPARASAAPPSRTTFEQKQKVRAHGGGGSTAPPSSQGHAPAQGSVVPPTTNGHHKYSSSRHLHGKTQVTSTGQARSFWTKCTTCKMQFEYLQIYLNCVLKCPQCCNSFSAIEIPPPSSLSQSSRWWSPHQQYQKRPGSNGQHNFTVHIPFKNTNIHDRTKRERDTSSIFEESSSHKRREMGDRLVGAS